MLCAIDSVKTDFGNTGSTTCNGDSGGPLVCLEGGKAVIAGITSFGKNGLGKYLNK